jgi:DNA replication protein DnaC
MSGNSLKNLLDKMQSQYDIEIPDMTPEEWKQEKITAYNETAGNLNEYDGYNCNLCKNKGHKLVLGENGVELYRECKCQQIRATLKRAKKSGLGDIIRDYTFDKFIDTEEWQKSVKQTAQEFCKDDTAKWFFIGGQVGCGKTHICTAISAHYIKAGKELKYMLWSEEAKRLKSLVNDSSYQELISPYKDIEVLYIDDFLKVKNGEEPTAADINLAFEIINHRLLDSSKITIISSEKILDEVMEYDEATMSRIYQKTGNYKISIGKDRKKNYRLRG